MNINIVIKPILGRQHIFLQHAVTDIFQIPIYMYVAYTQEGDTDTNTETNIANTDIGPGGVRASSGATCLGQYFSFYLSLRNLISGDPP